MNPLLASDIKDIMPISDYHVITSRYAGWQVLYRKNDYKDSRHKLIEHFISNELMPYKNIMIGIDIAADQSPFADIMKRLGHIWYRQDLSYPPGLRGNKAGGKASNLDWVDDNQIDAMTLHCSFEHFEDDEDIKFLQEAERALRPGGRVIILPLYTWQTYLLTPPQPSPNTGFGRFYDKEQLKKRIVDSNNLSKACFEVYWNNVYTFRALILEK